LDVRKAEWRLRSSLPDLIRQSIFCPAAIKMGHRAKPGDDADTAQ
jgi:hypothetical protein